MKGQKMKYALVIAMLFLGCSEEPEDLYWVKKYVNGLGESHYRVEKSAYDWRYDYDYWTYADNIEYKTKHAADSAMSVYVERKRMEWAKVFEPEDLGILGNTIRGNDSTFSCIMLIFIFIVGGMIVVAYNKRINRFLCRPLFRPKTKRRRKSN